MLESRAFSTPRRRAAEEIALRNHRKTALRSASALVPVGSLTGGAAAYEGPPCHKCDAKCCKYFALPIETPKDREDHDFMRWYLMHEHVVVWRQDGEWFLEVRTRCKNLLQDNRCAVYETRPQICREYGWPDEDNPDVPCDYFNDGLDYDLYFDTPEKYEAWAAVELEKREKRLARRREKYREKKAREAARGREACA